MKHIRHFRIVTTFVALLCVLFTQCAVAAYACPGMGLAMSQAAGQAAMPDCHGTDAMQPALCHAHDQSGKQSLDKPEIPPVLPFVPVRLVASLVLADDGSSASVAPIPEPALARATAPPLSIANCCFRN